MNMKILNSTINKLKKKNKTDKLKQLFSCLAFFRYTLSEQHRHDALNLLGVKSFRNKFSYLSLSTSFNNQLIAFDQENQLTANSPKKVAVCLSGDTRSLQNCIPQLKRFFTGFEVTFFCHGWQSDFDDKHIKNLGDTYSLVEDRPDFADIEKASIKAFGFKKFGNNLKVPFFSPNIIPMWYGVKRAFDSIAKNGFDSNDFDLICRCRYDNFFLGQLSQLTAELESNEVVIDPNYNGYGGYGDQFAIGRPEAMEKYFSLFNWLPKSFQQYAGDDRFFPEVIIQKFLENECYLNVTQIDFGLRILRNEFIGMEAHKIPLRSHSVSQARNKVVSEYIRNKFPNLYNEIG